MRKNERLAATAQLAAADMAALATELPAALDLLVQWTAGARSTPTDTTGHGSTDPGDAVLNAALTDDVIARMDQRIRVEVLKLARQAQTTLVRVRAVRIAEVAESTDIWCQHCARHGHRHVHGRHRVGGLTVCEWAWTWHRRTGHLPEQGDVDAHARGKRPGRRVEDSRKVVA